MTNCENLEVVIGIGNRYRHDDAVGLVAVQRLRQLFPEIPVCEFDGEATNLLEIWQGKEKVILIDACQANSYPGNIYRIDASLGNIDEEFSGFSTHTFSLGQVIELGKVLGQLPQELIIYGIVGEDFTQGEGLTFYVRAAVEEVVAAIYKRWQEWHQQIVSY